MTTKEIVLALPEGKSGTAKSVVAAANIKEAVARLEIWQTPKDIKTDLPDAPEFKANLLLPETLADFVLDESDRMPCAPDFIAAFLIVSLGSVIGTSCSLKPKVRDDWIVTPNLFGGVVGDPSTKKSPALGTVTRFLDRLEAKESEKLEDARKIFVAEMAAYEAHEAAIKGRMKSAAQKKGNNGQMNVAIMDLQDLQAPEVLLERRFKSNDSTVEKLGAGTVPAASTLTGSKGVASESKTYAYQSLAAFSRNYWNVTLLTFQRQWTTTDVFNGSKCWFTLTTFLGNGGTATL